MQKVYQRINWENYPSTKTAINEDNLNKMDYAIDEIDSRVVRYSNQYDSMVESTNKANTATSNANTAASKANTATANANSATDLALSAADEANNSVDALKSALEGTVINDETPSDGTTYSSAKIEKFDIQSSTDTTLHGTAPGGYRLTELVGATVQKTLSGKNLLENKAVTSTKNGVTFTVYDDGRVTTKGTATANAEFILNTKSYPVGNYKLVNPNGTRKVSAYIQDSNGTFISANGSNGGNISVTDETNLLQVHIYISANSVYDDVYYPMLLMADETDLTYEPYCGGIPSPNPDYPQAIENVGDCVEMIQGYYAAGSGAYANNANYVCNKHKIPCKQGDVIHLEFEKEPNEVIFVYYGENGYASYNDSFSGGKSAEVTVVNASATHFNFDVLNNNGITPQTVGKITLTVNEKYVGQIVTDLGVEMKQGYYSTSNGKYSDSANSVCSIDKFPCANGDTIKLKTENAIKFRIILYKDDTFVRGRVSDGYANEFSTTISDDVNYFHISLNCENGVTPETVGKVSVSINGVGEKVTTFYLNEPLRATDRLFKDGDGLFKVERKKGEDTKETVTTVNYLSDYGNRAYFVITPNNKKQDITRTAMSNKAIYSSNISDNMFYENITNFVVVGTADDTLETMQAKYNGTVIQYELATPTIEVLDPESQVALNSLETFDTVTYIEVDSKIPPTSISGEYGTSLVSARVLKEELRNDTDQVEREDMETQIETLRNMILSLGGNV